MSTPDKPKGPKLRPGMLSLETTPGIPLSFSGVTDSSLPYFHCKNSIGKKKKNLGVGRSQGSLVKNNTGFQRTQVWFLVPMW